MRQAEGGEYNGEALVTERQRCRVRSHRAQWQFAPTQRPERHIRRGHVGSSGRKRRPAGHTGAGPEVEHARPDQQRSHMLGQSAGQRRINRLRASCPGRRLGLVGRPDRSGQVPGSRARNGSASSPQRLGRQQIG